MNIQRRLEEIRRKPEHIKLRYTYIAVAISMFFILILWFFSLADTINKTRTPKNENVFKDMQSQKKSLKDATTDVKKTLDELNSNLKNATPDSDSQPINNNLETTSKSTETAPISDSPMPSKNQPAKDGTFPPHDNTRMMPPANTQLLPQ